MKLEDFDKLIFLYRSNNVTTVVRQWLLNRRVQRERI